MARFTSSILARRRCSFWLAVLALVCLTSAAAHADRGGVVPSGEFTFPGKYHFDDDFPNGNSNFSAEGGEVVDMEVFLLNDTGMGQTGITATILSAEPAAFIEVLLGTVAYPDMPEGNAESNFADLFQLRIGAGIPCRHIDLTLGISTDQGTYSVDLKLPLGQLTTFDDQLFVDSFEFGPGKWTLGGQWYYAQTSTCTSPTLGYVSPTRSMVFNKKATCEVGVIPEMGALTMASPVYIPAGLGAPLLEFNHLLSMPFDAEVTLEYMLNSSGTWELLEDFSGSGGGSWEFKSIPIDDLSGNDVQFRFWVDLHPGTVVRGVNLGWYIDDVVIVGDRYACSTFTAPTPTLPPCPTGTPAPTFTATPTPTATITPTSTPPVFVPAIFSVEGQAGQILANHSGVAPGGLRHFVAFWSRDANSQSNRWTYHGFVEYSDGQIQTGIPWKGPDVDTRHELAARLFIEGTGFSGPIVYGIATDLPKVFPEITALLHNDGNLSLDVTLNPGGLTSSLGMWSRPIIVQASPAPAEETGSWTYHGVTPYDLGSSFQHLAFDRDGGHFTMAAAVYAKGLGFLNELCYAAAPDFLEVFPSLKVVTANAAAQEITVEFRPAGNQPVEIGIWFREVDMSTCEPMCDWTFYGFHPYALNKREQMISWFPPDTNGHYQVAARMYVNHAFFDGFMGSYVFALPCSPVTTPPGTPSPTPTPSPSPTIAPTPTFTPTPTVTPVVTRRSGDSEKPGIKGGAKAR